MKDKKLQDILKAADDSTLRKLSGAAPLSQDDKDRIFAESMRKLKEKQGDTPRIIMTESRPGSASAESEQMPQIKSRASKAVVSAAAAIVLVIGITGVYLMNSSNLDQAEPPASASSENQVLSVSSSDSDESVSSDENAVTTVTAHTPDKDPAEDTSNTASAADSGGSPAMTSAGNTSGEPSGNTSGTSARTTARTTTATDDESADGTTVSLSSAADDSGDPDYSVITGDLLNAIGDFTEFTQGVDVRIDESVVYDNDLNATDLDLNTALSNGDTNYYLRVTDTRYPTIESVKYSFRDRFTDSYLEWRFDQSSPTPLLRENSDGLYFVIADYTARNNPMRVSYATEIRNITTDSFTFTIFFERSGYELEGSADAVLDDDGVWKINSFGMG